MKLLALIKRNIKLFFKDKGMVFASMITPLILLVLYITFLGNVYTDSFESSMPQGLNVPKDLVSATVAGELMSSILAVCCITVSFCSNMLYVQDKVRGTNLDFGVAPVKSSVLSISYCIATAVSSMIICYIAFGACLLYVKTSGWYMSFADIAAIALDIIILVLFGTVLSSIVNFFISTEGQMSAVGTIVSAGYGFICGAYMPISQFGDGLRKVLSFLPSTYGTSLLRNHALRGAFAEMEKSGFPEQVLDGVKESIDCKLYFFDNDVSVGAMLVYLAVSVVILLGVYILMNIHKERKGL